MMSLLFRQSGRTPPVTGAGETQSEAARLTCVRVHRHVHSSVYVLPVSDGDDEDQEPIIVYLVDHPVATDADATGWATGKLLAARGARIVCEATNSVDDALLACPVDLGELLLSNSQDFDRVAHAS